jgi:transcriptional regulator with XRE-family HTH domain
MQTGTFGTYFGELMRAAGYERVTALARATGVSHANLGRWLDDSATPSVDALRRVAPLLGVRLGDLMIRAGLATREELGTVGAPPPPGPALKPVERSIRSRFARSTDREQRALEGLLEDALAMYDRVVGEIQDAPREPRMRRR